MIKIGHCIAQAKTISKIKIRNIKIRKSKLKNKNALINKIKQQGGWGWVGEGTTYNGSYKWMICLGKYIKTNINTLIYILSAS